jgi:hypothetical protein
MDVYQRRRLIALSILAGAFVILVLLIRSCGGDDEETPVAPVAGATGVGGATALTQAEYIDQADAICLEANTSLASVDDSEPATAAAEEGQIVAGELEALQTLAAPTEGAGDLDAFLTALQDQVSAYDRYITALERGDDAAAAEIQTRIDEAAAAAQDAAQQFGFEVCGDPEQVSGSGDGGAAGGTDTGTDATAPTAPVTPAPTTTPAPPPTDGGVAPPAPPPTDDGGGGDSGSGGITP